MICFISVPSSWAQKPFKPSVLDLRKKCKGFSEGKEGEHESFTSGMDRPDKGINRKGATTYTNYFSSRRGDNREMTY